MTRTPKVVSTAALTPQRAARLYRFIELLASAPQTRGALMKKLKLDIRGFYRDLEYLRELAVDFSSDDQRYALLCDRDDALAKLPFPDPCLSLRDAMQLAKGSSDSHRKLRKRIEAITGK